MGAYTLKASVGLIQDLISNQQISLVEADDLLRGVEFHEREKCPLAWGKYYFPEKFTKEFCDELHGYLISIMYEDETFTLAPRDHAKSTIVCFLMPIYLAYVKPGMYKHFMLIQETSTKAKMTNTNLRKQIESNERLREDYGDQVGEKWTEKVFVMANGTAFSCFGVGESVRGWNVDNNRPDFAVIDDIYELSDCENSEAVRKKVEYYDADVSPAMADNSEGKAVSIHNIGTAINAGDHIHLAEKRGANFFRRFQAITDTDEKITLWKPFSWLMERKERLGSIVFSREFQNEIRDEASAIIKLSDIQYYDGRTFPTKQESLLEKRMNHYEEAREYVSWNRANLDPAEKTKEVNDFTAKVAGVYTNLGNFYIYDATNEKVSFNQNKEQAIAFYKRNNLDKMVIETNKGQAIYDEIRRTTSINVVGHHESVDKITRKVKQSAKFEMRKVFISMLIPDKIRNEIVDQLTTNAPNHDDLSDCVISILEMSDKQELFIG